MTRKSSTRVVLARVAVSSILAVLVPAGFAFAQAVDIPASLDPDLEGPPTAVTLQYGHQFKADVEDDGTEIARNNAYFGIMHRWKLADATSLFLLGTYTLHAYDFSGSTGPTNYYRWNEVHRMVIGGLVGHDLNDRWRIIGGGVFRSWGENGASYSDSISGGLLAGFDYHPSPDFSIGLLIGAFSALEDSLGLLPVPTLKWRFAEDWRLNIGTVSVMDPGIGAELSWQLDETLSFGTGFAFQARRFRLRDRARVVPPPGRPDRDDDGGVGQETEIPVFGLVRWRPTSNTAIDLLGGVALAGNLRVEDDDGGRIQDDSYDPAPFVGIKGQIAF